MQEEKSLARIKNYARSPEIVERFSEILGNRGASAYISSVLLAVSENRKLQACTPQSIITAAMRAAALRLSCDPATGQAWIIPYKGKAVFTPGYKGLKDMAIRTGRYRYLNVARIYKGQTVREDQLKGIHYIDGFRENGEIIGYLLYFELLSGYSKTYYMTVEEIRAHADKYAPSYHNKDSAWWTNFDDMAAKTVLSAGLKRWGYFDPNDALALAADETVYEDPTLPDPETVTAEEQPRRSVRQNMDELGFADAEFVDAEPMPDEEPMPEQEPMPGNGYNLRSAEQLKADLERNSRDYYAGRGVSKQQRGLLVGMLQICFGGDEGKRKEFCTWLTGHASTNDIPAPMVLAMIDWLDPVKDSGGAYEPSDEAVREANHALTTALKESGQMELI